MPGLLRARRRLRPRRRCGPAPTATATTGSSTARRSGRPARTSPTGASCSPAPTRTPQKHRGLSYLLVDMHSPGVEVRPLRQITGDPEFNEIFFTDVRVPRELDARGARRRVGRRDDDAAARARHAGLRADRRGSRQLRRLVALATSRPGRPRRRRPGGPRPDRASWIDLQALRFTNYRSLTALQKTGVPGPEGSIAKLHW